MLMPEAAVMHANMPRDTSSELAIVLSHLVAVLAGLSGLAVFIRWRLEKLSKQSRPPPQPQRTQRSNAASGYVTASKAQALPEKPLQGSGIEDSAGAVHPQTALATRSLEQKHSSSQVQDVVRMPCGEQGPRRSDDLLNDSVDDILSTKPDAELLATYRSARNAMSSGDFTGVRDVLNSISCDEYDVHRLRMVEEWRHGDWLTD